MNSYVFNVLLTEDEIKLIKQKTIIYYGDSKVGDLLEDLWEQIDPQYASQKSKEKKNIEKNKL